MARPPPSLIRPVKTLSAIAALLLSVFLLIAGNALVGVLTPLRASLDGFPDFAIGLLGSVYFAGMLAGTLATPAIVRRAGHIRAFSAFVAIGIVSIILMPACVAPAPWMASRGALGFVFAGIYAVVESWINAKASNANRGALYGVYQIVTFGASAGGQLLLRAFAPASYLPFTIGGALLALAIVPLTMTSVDPARPAEVGPPEAALARSAGARFGVRGVRGGRGQRRGLRARPGLRLSVRPETS
jgi:MFS family permease